MTAMASIEDRLRPPARWRRGAAGALVATSLAAALTGACTTREIEDLLHVSGKIAYDSMKARQQGQ
ncbi:MAG: hypothetical protein HYW28_09875 [Rhodospirillales bacterium]|nr:hypothetical protein [Rhodospirillales bacterium]